MNGGAPYCITAVSIAAVREQLADYLLEYFNPAERNLQQNEPVQSIAGRVALKRAVCALTQAYGPEGTVSPTSVVIDRDNQGAPRVINMPPSLATLLRSDRERLYVSISHSKTTAVGMAILSQRGNP